jgi:hypothetical protein
MRYYIVLLLNGKVVEITTYDDELERNKWAERFKDRIYGFDLSYDEIQTHNEVR